MRPIVVFDTNILISGTVWKGKPYRCLEFARTGAVRSVTCQEILAEFREKLLDKFERPAAWVHETILDLLDFTDVVPITNTLHVIAADAEDDKIVECAVVSGADFIVTGDRHLLTIGKYQGIAIVTASVLLSSFASQGVDRN